MIRHLRQEGKIEHNAAIHNLISQKEKVFQIFFSSLGAWLAF